MRWEDERYVRLYTRDTLDWLALSFEAQALLSLLLRKVDRAGVLRLGRHGTRGVAVAIGHPAKADAIAAALEELVRDGVVALREDSLVIPNFIEAQEAKQSDRARKQAQRERDRDRFLADGNPEATSQSAIDKVSVLEREGLYGSPASQNVTESHALSSQPVTKRDEKSHGVTSGHAASHGVTPSLAVPAEPSCAEPAVTPKPAVAAANPVSAMGGVALPPQAIRELADRRHIPRTVEKPQAPPEEWSADDFLQWTKWLLQSNGLVPSNERPPGWSAWYSNALMSPGVRVKDLMGGFMVFGQNKYWEDEGFPLSGWISQWDNFVNKGKARAAG